MIWPILFMFIPYFIIGWIGTVLYNTGQIRKYGKLLEGEDEAGSRFCIMVFWPIAIIVMLFYWGNMWAKDIAEHEYQRGADIKAAKIIKEAKERLYLLNRAKLLADEKAAKLLNENNFERDETTNFKSGIDR